MWDKQIESSEDGTTPIRSDKWNKPTISQRLRTRQARGIKLFQSGNRLVQRFNKTKQIRTIFEDFNEIHLLLLLLTVDINVIRTSVQLNTSLRIEAFHLNIVCLITTTWLLEFELAIQNAKPFYKIMISLPARPWDTRESDNIDRIDISSSR